MFGKPILETDTLVVHRFLGGAPAGEKGDEVERPKDPIPPASESEKLLPGSSSLAVLLITFVTISMLVLFSIVRGGVGHVADDDGGTVAYGPADVDGVDFEIELLPGIEDAGADSDESTFLVPPPPWSESGYFPCTECHADLEPNPEPRELIEMHDDIVLKHGPSDRWCLDCHNPDDRDVLRLVNGKLIPFEESYLLCGQCHGTIFRDWRQGIHGRRQGFWNGGKSYLLCAHCHDPHAPAFHTIKPLPPPVRPQYLAGSAPGEIETEEATRE